MPRYMQGKVIYPKYYKKCAYALAQKLISCALSYFDPKKYTLNLQFNDFYVNQLFSAEAGGSNVQKL